MILLTGIGLLLTTFVIACIHLYGQINVFPLTSILVAFGEILSPLLEAGIRVLYLGLMGWISLTVTSRGITLLLSARLHEKNKLNSH